MAEFQKQKRLIRKSKTINVETFSKEISADKFTQEKCEKNIETLSEQTLSNNSIKEKADEMISCIRNYNEKHRLNVVKNIFEILRFHYDKNSLGQIKADSMVKFLELVLKKCIKSFDFLVKNETIYSNLMKSFSTCGFSRSFRSPLRQAKWAQDNLRSETPTDNKQNANNNLNHSHDLSNESAPKKPLPESKKKAKKTTKSSTKDNKNKLFKSKPPVKNPEIVTRILHKIYFRLCELKKEEQKLLKLDKNKGAKKYNFNENNKQELYSRTRKRRDTRKFDKLGFLYELDHEIRKISREQDIKNISEIINGLLKKYKNATAGLFSETEKMLKDIRSMLVKQGPGIKKNAFNL